MLRPADVSALFDGGFPAPTNKQAPPRSSSKLRANKNSELFPSMEFLCSDQSEADGAFGEMERKIGGRRNLLPPPLESISLSDRSAGVAQSAGADNG